jgi:subfamily B ATP-binding cassette protein MsbA
MVVAIVALLFYSGVSLFFPLVIVELLRSVLSQTDMGPLNNMTLALIGLFLLQSAGTFIQSYNLTYIGERVVLDLRTALYRQLQALSLDFYANRRGGEIVAHFQRFDQSTTVLTTNIARCSASLRRCWCGGHRLCSIGDLVRPDPAPVLIAVAVVWPPSRDWHARADELANATVAVEGLQGIRVVRASHGRLRDQSYNSAIRRTFLASIRLALFRAAFAR